MKRVFLSIFLIAVAVLAAACEKTSISKLKADPTKYIDKEVGIIGTVRDSYGIPFVGGVYKIDDGTGSIWVVSEKRSVPSKGAKVGVKGYVQDGVKFGGQNYGLVLRENQRKVK